LAPTLPNLVAPLREGGQVWEIPGVDYVPDVCGHLVEEQDLLDLVHRGWLQGVELVHQDRWLVHPEARVVQSFDSPLVVAESV
jgi:hypothetical protein